MLSWWLEVGSPPGPCSPELKPRAGQHRPSQSSPRYRLVNQDRATILAERIQLAGCSAARRNGLRRRASLEITEGLAIAPCEAIHTFGMRFPIDVVFLDMRYCIRHVVEGLKPNRIAVCFAAALAVELSSGTLQRSKSSTGDLLGFELVEDQDRTYPNEGQADLGSPGKSTEERPPRADLS
ncbi:MAG: DUF192 domain-containing protein [Bryobacteraceae bacterium]